MNALSSVSESFGQVARLGDEDKFNKTVKTNPFSSDWFIMRLFHGKALHRNQSGRGFQVAPPPNVSHRDTEVAQILSVLEDKVGNKEVAEKLRDKVFALSDKQTRLIASLARLTANGDQAAGAEIVFFVMTILIIVS
jgi:hypothetical protein